MRVLIDQRALPLRPLPPFVQHIFAELANAQNAPNSTMGRMVTELVAIGKTIESKETLTEDEKHRAAESKVEADRLKVRGQGRLLGCAREVERCRARKGTRRYW